MDAPEADIWMQVESRRIVMAAEEMLTRHEAEDHDGEFCLPERAGFVAFVAHCLGVSVDDNEALKLLVDAMTMYQEAHDEHSHGTNGNGGAH